MTEKQKEVLCDALWRYGEENQLRICMEECAELIQAISKVQRYPESKEHKANLLEEIADVLICIEYIKLIYGISEMFINKEIDKEIEYKIQRISRRMKGENDNDRK